MWRQRAHKSLTTLALTLLIAVFGVGVSCGELGKPYELSLPVAPLLEKKIKPATPVKTEAPVPEKKIVINVAARKLFLVENGQVKTYSVGVGRRQFQTPLGHYSVIRKVINPGWENPYLGPGAVRVAPGNGNPLGTRWIGFKQDGKGEYGIHGTDTPDSVGKYSSHGCVRMYIRDAEALFDSVEYGTPVEVVYEPVLFMRKDNRLLITVYPDFLGKGMPSLSSLQDKIQKSFPTLTLTPDALQNALQAKAAKPVAIGSISDEQLATDHHEPSPPIAGSQ